MRNDNLLLFEDLVLLIAKHTKTIIITLIVSQTIAVIYFFFIVKPIYVSSSKIMSSSNSPSVSQAVGFAAQLGINLPTADQTQNWVYPEIIQSQAVCKRLLQKKFKYDSSSKEEPLINILLKNKSEMQSITKDKLETAGINVLKKMMAISENKKNGIITLSIQSESPSLATKINNALINELDLHQREYNKAKTGETRVFIEERIIETQKELNRIEEQLKNFMDRNRRIENSPNLLLKRERLQREVSVQTGVFTTLKQQLEKTKIDEVRDSDYVIIIDDPSIPLGPSKPRKSLMIILTTLFAFLSGFLVGLLRDYFNNQKSIKKIQEAKFHIYNGFSELIRFYK